MKAIKIIVLAAVIAVLYTFWIVPRSKKLVEEWRTLRQIKAMYQQLEDGCMRIVPIEGWPIN